MGLGFLACFQVWGGVGWGVQRVWGAGQGSSIPDGTTGQDYGTGQWSG